MPKRDLWGISMALDIKVKEQLLNNEETQQKLIKFVKDLVASLNIPLLLLLLD